MVVRVSFANADTLAEDQSMNSHLAMFALGFVMSGLFLFGIFIIGV
jgi:hypothetical protein